MKQLSVNVDHISNSSSVVYSFPKEILENVVIQYIKKYTLQKRVNFRIGE